MRSRSNSGVKLDTYSKLIQNTILNFQDPVTGLFPAEKNNPHAWVRDNLYSIQAVWGLALAYKKHADLDEDKAKAYELSQSVVKCMRSLLNCMMRQVDKLERFKKTQSTNDALHAKYNLRTCGAVVGDKDWGHLQLDAVGLYLLMLSQMTASGMSLVYSLDEVSFIQNLVFYIESAYRTPDYGIWERGDKTNHGVPELNASSVGMCKAALEAIDELDLFGGRGGPQSVIHVAPDEKAQCQAILYSMLPRESNSKEVDAALLSIIGYPAFAVSDENLIKLTQAKIREKLQGNYGCSRFLRDGYKTAREDPNRLHYELAELKVFDNIECEWPLFWAYLILDGIFFKKQDQVVEYREALQELLVFENGMRVLPELYTVPACLVEAEKKNPHSQERVAAGKIPHLWGHSLYILGELLWEGFLVPGEIDPLNRRFVTAPKPDLVVQVVLLSETREIQRILRSCEIETKTVQEITPVRVQPAKVLAKIYSLLGNNRKLGLTGHPSNAVGILGTSKVYDIKGSTYLFTPQFLDQEDFYMSLDIDMLIDIMMTELQYLCDHWTMCGRPLITFTVTKHSVGDKGRIHPHLISTIKKIYGGYFNGVRVVMGDLQSMLRTSCYTELDFLQADSRRDGDVDRYLSNILTPSAPRQMKLESVSSQLDVHRSDFRLCRRHSSTIEKMQDAIDLKLVHDLHLVKHGHTVLGKLIDSSDTIRNAVSCNDISIPKISIDALLRQLVDYSTTIEERADILQYLYIHKGSDWDTCIGGTPGTPVSELVEDLYEQAGQERNWLVVRQVTGLLKKRVTGLSQSVTDLLVRQKQLTVGLPPEPREKTITRPLPLEDLHELIMDAFGDDTDIAVLTQEIIIYLAMFIRSNPGLFSDLLRLRVGLIIQVMASELARHLKCSGLEASMQLMSLSPYEMKCLIHNILSGTEFGISKARATAGNLSTRTPVSSKVDKAKFTTLQKKLKKRESRVIDSTDVQQPASSADESTSDETSAENKGQWIRRRRIDGALNRVPHQFYSRVWKLLEKCYGMMIGVHYIPGYVTKEMTPGELKFALLVENVLNHIPQPEYRQLVVETMVILSLISDAEGIPFLSDNIRVDEILNKADQFFYDDLVKRDAPDCLLTRDANSGICLEFYDCAPSGTYGTMSYLSKAVIDTYSSAFPKYIQGCYVS